MFRVDLDAGTVENVTKDRSFTATPLPPFMQEILDAGGLMPWVARSLHRGGGDADVDGDAAAVARVHVGVSEDEPAQADWRLD